MYIGLFPINPVKASQFCFSGKGLWLSLHFHSLHFTMKGLATPMGLTWGGVFLQDKTRALAYSNWLNGIPALKSIRGNRIMVMEKHVGMDLSNRYVTLRV